MVSIITSRASAGVDVRESLERARGRFDAPRRAPRPATIARPRNRPSSGTTGARRTPAQHARARAGSAPETMRHAQSAIALGSSRARRQGGLHGVNRSRSTRMREREKGLESSRGLDLLRCVPSRDSHHLVDAAHPNPRDRETAPDRSSGRLRRVSLDVLLGQHRVEVGERRAGGVRRTCCRGWSPHDAAAAPPRPERRHPGPAGVPQTCEVARARSTSACSISSRSDERTWWVPSVSRSRLFEPRRCVCRSRSRIKASGDAMPRIAVTAYASPVCTSARDPAACAQRRDAWAVADRRTVQRLRGAGRPRAPKRGDRLSAARS